MKDLKTILLGILEEASSKNYTIGTTQLIKLLYLIEVKYYQATSERFTDLDWIFYRYGPYAFELDTILQEKEFQRGQIETQSGNKFIRFRVAETASGYGKKIEPKVDLLIKQIVGTWGSRPLEQLLDYVYFETEPMELVKQRGDALDFSTIKPASEIPSVIPLKASHETEKKVAKLREKIKPFLESMGQSHIKEQEPSIDYIEAMKAWDGVN